MLMPKNLRELIETLESLTHLSRCNAALAHLPIDGLLQNILGGEFKQALQSFTCLLEPLREKSPEAADDLEKIISGELPPREILTSSYLSVYAMCSRIPLNP
jgi:hypothetical protein